MSINIQFVKSHDNPKGTVSGHLEVRDNGWTSQESRYLGDLTDVHPDFAAHIVKAVNAHAAVLKIIEAEGQNGPVRAALEGALA